MSFCSSISYSYWFLYSSISSIYLSNFYFLSLISYFSYSSSLSATFYNYLRTYDSIPFFIYYIYSIDNNYYFLVISSCNSFSFYLFCFFSFSSIFNNSFSLLYISFKNFTWFDKYFSFNSLSSFSFSILANSSFFSSWNRIFYFFILSSN